MATVDASGLWVYVNWRRHDTPGTVYRTRTLGSAGNYKYMSLTEAQEMLGALQKDADIDQAWLTIHATSGLP